jgi:hypothetical protein
MRTETIGEATMKELIEELTAVLERIVESVSVGPSGEVCQASDFDDARAVLAKAKAVVDVGTTHEN